MLLVKSKKVWILQTCDMHALKIRA